jgi:hypothetical protein
MPITDVQQGVVAELLFIVLSVLGSDGALEVARQATDDDRRDADVHRRGDFLVNLGFQIKSSIRVVHPSPADSLHIRFTVLKARLVSHPLFYYFFGYLDLGLMRFADPVFIIPSAEVHEHAVPRLHGDTWHFDFQGSLAPVSNDRWVPYRVSTQDVGKRIMAVISDLEKNQTALALDPNAALLKLLWVRRAA